jgi:hypothetical protein
MPSWAAQALQTAHFRDARLTKRLIRMVEDFAAQPTASVRLLGGHQSGL